MPNEMSTSRTVSQKIDAVPHSLFWFRLEMEIFASTHFCLNFAVLNSPETLEKVGL